MRWGDLDMAELVSVNVSLGAARIERLRARTKAYGGTVAGEIRRLLGVALKAPKAPPPLAGHRDLGGAAGKLRIRLTSVNAKLIDDRCEGTGESFSQALCAFIDTGELIERVGQASLIPKKEGAA